MATALYPLRFQYLGRRYLWGGRRLGDELGKPIGPESDHAESWEIVDLRGDQSIVAAGEHAGLTLAQLVHDYGAELLGRHAPLNQFPLLIKFLDASQALSIQVHPNNAQAALHMPRDFGKTEAWVILAAEPGSVVYAGLKPGVDRTKLQAAIHAGSCDELVHRVTPNVGDCFFIPPGTVHAIGPGLLLVEVQQSSDTTFRLFDWNRVGVDGNSRALHVEKGLSAVDFERGPVEPQRPQPTDRPWAERLVACKEFVIDRWKIAEPRSIGGDERFHIVVVLEGSVSLAGDRCQKPLGRGSTALLPAAMRLVSVTPHESTILLDVYLP